jgi:hypothetical protein
VSGSFLTSLGLAILLAACAAAAGIYLSTVIEKNVSGPLSGPLAEAIAWGLFWLALFPLFQYSRARRTAHADPTPSRSLLMHALGALLGVTAYQGIRMLVG